MATRFFLSTRLLPCFPSVPLTRPSRRYTLTQYFIDQRKHYPATGIPNAPA